MNTIAGWQILSRGVLFPASTGIIRVNVLVVDSGKKQLTFDIELTLTEIKRTKKKDFSTSFCQFPTSSPLRIYFSHSFLSETSALKTRYCSKIQYIRYLYSATIEIVGWKLVIDFRTPTILDISELNQYFMIWNWSNILFSHFLLGF